MRSGWPDGWCKLVLWNRYDASESDRTGLPASERLELLDSDLQVPGASGTFGSSFKKKLQNYFPFINGLFHSEIQTSRQFIVPSTSLLHSTPFWNLNPIFHIKGMNTETKSVQRLMLLQCSITQSFREDIMNPHQRFGF